MPNSGDPVLAIDSQSIVASTTGRPLIRLVQQTTQTLADNTAVAMQFGAGSEDIDTHNYHDTATNNTRITPTLAGYYRFDFSVMFGARADYANYNAWIRKNGSSNMAPAFRASWNATGASSNAPTAADSVIVAMDGVSDYVELIAQQDNIANVSSSTNASVQFSSTLQGEYLRPL